MAFPVYGQATQASQEKQCSSATLRSTHRLDRRRLVAAAERGDRDRPPRRVGPERAQHDVVAHVGERERRDQRHSHAGRHQPLLAEPLRGLEADLRLEPGGVGGDPQRLRAHRVSALDPRLVREVGHADLVGLGERMVARDREMERVVHQVVEHDLAGDLRQPVGVGDDRDVDLAGREPRDQLGRDRLVEP
jgi:hypothetical protein